MSTYDWSLPVRTSPPERTEVKDYCSYCGSQVRHSERHDACVECWREQLDNLESSTKMHRHERDAANMRVFYLRGFLTSLHTCVMAGLSKDELSERIVLALSKTEVRQ